MMKKLLPSLLAGMAFLAVAIVAAAPLVWP